MHKKTIAPNLGDIKEEAEKGDLASNISSTDSRNLTWYWEVKFNIRERRKKKKGGLSMSNA
jgi:hypothetical protein